MPSFTASSDTLKNVLSQLHNASSAVEQELTDTKADNAKLKRDLQTANSDIATLKKVNAEMKRKLCEAPDHEDEIKRLRDISTQHAAENAHMKDRETKRRKLCKDANYAMALTTACADAGDHVLVHWASGDMWSVAQVEPKYKPECPSMLFLKCSVTQDDQHIFACVHPSDVSPITSKNVEKVLRKVVDGTNLKALAQTGKNRNETDREFARRVLKQTASAIRCSLSHDVHIVTSAESVVATSTPELQ